RVEWITCRLKMGVTSNFSCYVRAVEQSKDGLLWELKNKISRFAWEFSCGQIPNTYLLDL
ncbi:MAG: hypothetical protein U9P12_05450, partial [Verrucomicrobiota bacterium]|nr:hypothetical protein [Verrucomicrobiota bacterium]